MKEREGSNGSAVDVEKIRKVMRIQRMVLGLVLVALVACLAGVWIGGGEVSWWLIGLIAGQLVVNLSLLNQNRQLLESSQKPEDKINKE